MQAERWTDERRRARFAELARYELVGAGTLVFFFVVFYQAGPLTQLSGIATVPAVVLLLQGALFWWVEYRALRDGDGYPRWVAPVFRGLRVADVGLLLVCGVVIGRGLPHAGLGDQVFSVAMLLLGGAEYVNYFHWQLMYDNRTDITKLVSRRRLKRSLLWRRLSKAA